MTLERKMEERFKAGIEVGREQILRDMISKKLAKGKSISQIAEECEESIETIQTLITETDLK